MRFVFSFLWIFAVLPMVVPVHAAQPKQVVGATEMIEVVDASLTFNARVDTGAKSSSIHAVDIQVDTSGKPDGKPIAFRIVNQDGQSRQINARVDSVVVVRTSKGSEPRYKVPLTLKWKDSSKTVLVTLNDRSSMSYRLLLGRNWLRGDYLVDVELNSDE